MNNKSLVDQLVETKAELLFLRRNGPLIGSRWEKAEDWFKARYYTQARDWVKHLLNDTPATDHSGERKLEQVWLHEHRHEYLGKWVALDGASLVASEDSALTALRAARAFGCRDPLVVHIPSDPNEPSFGGW